jgi:hypothetical protein
MDSENTGWGTSSDGVDTRDRIRAALAKEGLGYSRGGYIHGCVYRKYDPC